MKKTTKRGKEITLFSQENLKLTITPLTDERFPLQDVFELRRYADDRLVQHFYLDLPEISKINIYCLGYMMKGKEGDLDKD